MNTTEEQIGSALVVSGEVVPDQIMIRREPDEILEEASKAARALKKVMDGKSKKVVMNGEQYIENEDWITIGRFYGLTAKIESDRYVQYGDAKGFEAIAVVIDPNGIERGRATAMCLDDEEKWGERAAYEYQYVLLDGTLSPTEPADPFKTCQIEPTGKKRDDGSLIMRPKRVKQQVGTTKVPLFQLRSMAQTRASSKALNMLLRFVPVLAGYKATPAEELDGQTQTIDAEVVTTRQARTTQTTQTTTQQNAPQTNGHAPAENGNGQPRTISQPQVKRLWAIVKDIGIDRDAVAEKIQSKYGIASSSDIPTAKYDEIVNAIKDKSILG